MSGSGPGSARRTCAPSPSQAASAGGSSTVAERPTRRRPGARVCRRARPSMSWSPRLLLGERVDLVDDDAGEAGEDARGLLVGEHEGEGLGRGEQDVRRVDALAGALARGGVAGAVLDADARGPSRRAGWRGCGGCRRRAPSAARRRGCGGRAAGAGPSSTRLGRKPASVLPPPVGATSSVAGSAARARSASWCGCGVQPRRANQAAKRGGRTGAGPLMPLSFIAAAPSGHGAARGVPCGQC